MAKAGCGYVFGYVNPDTDGVCSSIGYAFFATKKGRNFKPLVFGTLNKETNFVLGHLRVDPPAQGNVLDPHCEVVIVDTHDRSQLPPGMDPNSVVEILDHHPSGDFRDFPKAKIQNDKVGAVATLVAERMMKSSIEPTSQVAGVLAAAIVSNTLNFTAPSTSRRDLSVFKWLSGYEHLTKQFINNMFKARSDISDKKTAEVLLADYKQFKISSVQIGISQFETTYPQDLLSRPDLKKVLTTFRDNLNIDYFFVNVVDMLKQRSTLMAADAESKELLRHAIGARFNEYRSEFPRVLLRKTNLVPRLEKWLKAHPT